MSDERKLSAQSGDSRRAGKKCKLQFTAGYWTCKACWACGRQRDEVLDECKETDVEKRPVPDPEEWYGPFI